MKVEFFGVRGSIAVSGRRFERVGGATSCVSLEHEGHRLVLDGGTGLRSLGERLGHGPVTATLLFSHVHWDHIQGVPFFAPAFHPGSALTLVGVERVGARLQDVLALQMRPPTFPVGLSALRGVRRFVDLPAGQPLEVGPFRVRALEQDHPDGVVAYDIQAGGRRVVYATDIEHAESLSPSLLALAEGCDLLIHDAQYTPEEYAGVVGPSRRGWGHSPWTAAVQIATLSQAAQLALFHHDPTRDDDRLDHLEASAKALFPRTFAAREGQVVAL